MVEYHAHRRTSQLLLAKFVLRFRIEVACSMAFVQLLSGITCGAIDDSASLNCGSLGNHLCPADDVNVILPPQEFARIVLRALR